MDGRGTCRRRRSHRAVPEDASLRDRPCCGGGRADVRLYGGRRRRALRAAPAGTGEGRRVGRRLRGQEQGREVDEAAWCLQVNMLQSNKRTL